MGYFLRLGLGFGFVNTIHRHFRKEKCIRTQILTNLNLKYEMIKPIRISR